MPGKKQHSLFDLSSVQRHQKKEPALPSLQETQNDDEAPVSCPVCSKPMASLDMHLRIQHVEACLTLQLLHEETEGTKTLKKEMVKEECITSKHTVHHEQVKTIVVSDSELEVKPKEEEKATKKQTPTKEQGKLKEEQKKETHKKRDLGAVQKENLKYINSKPSVKRPRKAKVEEPPTELLVSSRKNAIPELKVIRFSVSPQNDYCVSVDAFNFKPSEYIHQYFLSHFHSDHYGGISKRWCRERTLDSKIIYCSEITARLLNIRYNIDSCFVFSMQNNLRYRVRSYTEPSSEACVSEDNAPGLYVTAIDANHCPGAVIFLFESISMVGEKSYYLHCGDFRVCESIMKHPLLKQFSLKEDLKLNKVYLDTTYMSPKHNFPKQEQVCTSIADLIEKLVEDEPFSRQCFGKSTQSRLTDLLSLGKSKKKLLVLVGTYLIGKERLATAISRRMSNAPIYVSNTGSRGDKEQIIRSYKDEYIDSVLTTDPTLPGDHSVMIHLVPMSTAGNIQDIAKYFNHNQYHQNFERCIGIRPTGWSFQSNENEEDKGIKTEQDKLIETEVQDMQAENQSALFEAEDRDEMLKIEGHNVEEDRDELFQQVQILRKHPEYSYLDIVRQNTPKRYGKVDSSLYRSFAVPYSEHSSFRELSFFTIFFNIQRVIPTVNTGNEWSIKRMNDIIKRWEKIREMIKKGSASEKLTLEDF